MQVSFTPEFADRLRKEIGSDLGKTHNPHGGGNTYELERYLDEDLLLTSVGWANSYYQSDKAYVDEWGIGWDVFEYETKFGKGNYTEIVTNPLAEDSAIDSYQPPDPNRDELYDEARRVIKTFKDEYWIVGVTVTTIWETAWALRGLEKMLMDLVLNPDLANRILDIPHQYHLTAAKRLTQMGVDMIWIGDDVSTQQGMLINPEMWRQLFKPRMAGFIAALKEINPEVKVAYHCDGDLYPIIPDLIEIGLDVLNPIQPACIDPAKIKQDFGDKLCFWGTIDEQYTLPFGSAAEVENEVKKRLATIGKNGGLILGPTHHVQLDTPMENFQAMVNTITNSPLSG
jgi:uroporphyrinogen decarboxylase